MNEQNHLELAVSVGFAAMNFLYEAKVACTHYAGPKAVIVVAVAVMFYNMLAATYTLTFKSLCSAIMAQIKKLTQFATNAITSQQLAATPTELYSKVEVCTLMQGL